MRIALVTPRYASHSGAVERHARELARGLTRRGAAVEVITPEREPCVQRESGLEDVVVRRFPASHPNARVVVTPALTEYLRRTAGSFDLVHAHGAHMLLVLAAVHARPRRLVFSPQAPMTRVLSWPYVRAVRAVVARAARTICTSHADADLLRRVVSDAADRVLVVPHGVDSAAIRAANPFSTLRTVVLTVGRLERRKRMDRAIAAMASLDPAFELVVIGDGPARRRLMGHAADLDVSARVRFTGPVSDADLHRWLRTGQVIVTLSQEESFGLQVLEGVAAGAPVVASDIPAHREASDSVLDGGVTFVAPEGSPLEVADAIRSALTLPVPAPVRPLPSWEDVVDTTLALYEQLIRSPPANGTRRPRLGKPRPLERNAGPGVASKR